MSDVQPVNDLCPFAETGEKESGGKEIKLS